MKKLSLIIKLLILYFKNFNKHTKINIKKAYYFYFQLYTDDSIIKL